MTSKKPAEEHKLCATPSFTPFSDAKDKFDPGAIWQCAECQRIYLATGYEPAVEGFWRSISIRKANRLINSHKGQLLR